MIDKEVWAEALNLAKDQLRHGKVHFSELEVVTKSIYEKLISLKSGPIIDIEPEPMKQIEAQQHTKTRKSVKCAICGKEGKVLTSKHLASHVLLSPGPLRGALSKRARRAPPTFRKRIWQKEKEARKTIY